MINFSLLLIVKECIIELEKYHEAIESYEMSIKIKPNNSYAYNGKGSSLNQLKKFSEAIEIFEKAIILYPHNLFAIKGRENAFIGLKIFYELNELLDYPKKVNNLQLDLINRTRKELTDPQSEETENKISRLTEFIICCSIPNSAIFAPCGHKCCCEKCADNISTIGNKECPYCKQTNLATVKKVFN